MSSAKRAPALPKPNASLSSSAVISENASLVGSSLITIQDNTVIHPRSKIISTHGPVTIGRTCIISERSTIGLQSVSETQPDGVVIEDFVVIEVGAIVEAKKVGKGSVIEVNAHVGHGAILGKHCKIGPLCTVDDGEVLPDFTVVYGKGLRRIDGSGVEEMKMKMVTRQVEVLRKLIPSNPSKFQ